MKTLLQTLIVLFITLQLNAQRKTITGTVTSANDGLPLPGVTVIVKGTQNGSATDFDGNFSIEANTGDTLLFAYVGYKTKKITVGTYTTLRIALEEDQTQLDEVVVTAYSAKRQKKALGYAVSTVRSDAIKRNSKSKINSKLKGRVAGVKVNNNGYAGTGTNIIIRGYSSISENNKPLFVIDGVPLPGKKLFDLDPTIITSTKVLKGLSATQLYGSRGKNGVIVITTKNGLKAFNPNMQYMVDGIAIDKKNNAVIRNLETSKIESKIEYNSAEAKKQFGNSYKAGCIVITTHQGNYRIPSEETYAAIHENNFEKTILSPLSTFSIDVDKAGYSNVRRLINNGENITSDAVKIEEMVNYFNYNYPQPSDAHPFSIHTELVNTPWHKATKLVRIGLQGKTIENENLPASNLTFLIDVSGSMGSQNKLPLLKSAFKLLVNQLRAKDKVAIVVYAGAAGVVLEPTPGNQKEKIIAALDNLNSGGSTAGGEGITLAYALAEKHFKKQGNNRVILATDGDFNVGASSDSEMEKLITQKRNSGVFLSVLGFGYGNYKDSKLETLADKGNGNHAYIDTMQEAQKVFGKEFGGTLFTIAKDVKIQVEFNPKKVSAYRLIGYENRMLADEDFIDDTIDAGELGSGHTVTALYEIVPIGAETSYVKSFSDLKYTTTDANTHFSDDWFTVKFRYKKPDASKSIELSHVCNTQVLEPSKDMNFAAAVALFGMQLRQSKYFNNAPLSKTIALATSGKGEDKDGYRSEFVRLVKAHSNKHNL